MFDMTKVFLCAAILSLCVTSAQAEVYRWVDKDGKTHYSDNPPPDAKAGKTKIVDSNIESAKFDYETTRIAKIAPITLYVSADCKEPCADARKLLTTRKLPFAEKRITTQEEFDALAALIGKKAPLVPTLSVGRKQLEGFEVGAWNSALDAVGYAKP